MLYPEVLTMLYDCVVVMGYWAPLAQYSGLWYAVPWGCFEQCLLLHCIMYDFTRKITMYRDILHYTLVLL
jgi:hypothetical protein